MGDMIMARSKADMRLDYYPVIAIFLFWFFGAFGASISTRNPYLFAMGFVTFPAVAVMALSAYKIYKSHQQEKLE
jgi:hypothetical protein